MMILRNLLLLSTALFVFLFVHCESAYAQYTPYVWEKIWVTPNNSPTQNEQDVLNELSEIITEYMDWVNETSPPRPPGPFYVAQGYLQEDFYWLNTGETVLILAESLDFLSQDLRDEVIAYLKYVMTTPNISPLTFSVQDRQAHPLMDRDNFRSYYPNLPDELSPGFITSGDTYGATHENLYAVWTFAHYVSQFESPTSLPTAWDIIESSWGDIDSLYSQTPSTPQIYWDIMAHIGYARMARETSRPYAAAEANAISGFTAGTNFQQFYQNSKSSRWCEGNDGTPNGWSGTWEYCLFTLNPSSLYISDPNSPWDHNEYAGHALTYMQSMFGAEIGRFLRDNVQNEVITNSYAGLNRFLDPSGLHYFPFWWENKGDKPWAIRDGGTDIDGNGENAIMHPSFSWQMFLLKAYVEGTGLSNARADTMKGFLDTAWTIGDNFQIQKLVTLARMYAQTQWSDNDPRGATPTPSPTPLVSSTPTPIPTPTPLSSDINTDGNVDSLDANLIFDNWGVPTNSNTDLDQNGKANSRDYSYVHTDWGTAAPTNTPAPTATPLPTATPVPTATPIPPTSTPTPVPTATETPTPSPTGAPTPTPSGSGTSLRFYGNGIDDIDRIKIPVDNPETKADIGATDFTIEWWMKAENSNNSPGSCGDWICGNIIFDRDIFASTPRKFGISLNNGNIWFGSNDIQTIWGSENVADNQWHHVAVTRNVSTGEQCIYVDGVQDICASTTAGDISYPDGQFQNPWDWFNSNPYLVIGAEKHDYDQSISQSPPEYPAYNGLLDEVRISNTLRYTGTYTTPTAPFTSDANTILLYHFDEGSGTTVNDAASNPLNATLEVGGSPSGPMFSNDTPF